MQKQLAIQVIKSTSYLLPMKMESFTYKFCKSKNCVGYYINAPIT